jgi:hypothetical protein
MATPPGCGFPSCSASGLCGGCGQCLWACGSRWRHFLTQFLAWQMSNSCPRIFGWQMSNSCPDIFHPCLHERRAKERETLAKGTKFIRHPGRYTTAYRASTN